jgi:hypothetical protein
LANEKGPEQTSGVVRLEKNEGAWKLASVEGAAHTDVTYCLHTDPGGSISNWTPAVLLNWGISKGIPDLFEALAKAATQRMSPGR